MNDGAIFLIYRVIVHRRQAASYRTTCKPLKKLDFVGADRAAFRLSANAAFQSLNFHRLYHLFADKSAPTVRCLLRGSATSKT